jgi:hypothetical protein
MSDIEKYSGRYKRVGPLTGSVGNMAAGATHVIANGRIITGVYSADADAASLLLEWKVDGTNWEPVVSQEGTAWVGSPNEHKMTPRLMCDGTRIRIRNSHGANSVDAVYYTYEV